MTFRSLLCGLILGTPLLLVGACSSTNKTEAACSPGQSQPCVCPGGGQGAQICQDDGLTFSECDCGGGTGGTGGGGGAAGGAAGMGGGPPTPNCDSYCDLMVANCRNENQQWANRDTCIGACSAFEIGDIADTPLNTLGCRQFHASLSLEDPDNNCERAGPSGGEFCGGRCEGYCTLIDHICPFPVPGSYPDRSLCTEACQGFVSDGDFDASITAGNTLECRTYHVSVAAENPNEGSDSIHCPHSGETPTAACVDPMP